MSDGAIDLSGDARAKAYATPLDQFDVADPALFQADAHWPWFERLRAGAEHFLRFYHGAGRAAVGREQITRRQLLPAYAAGAGVNCRIGEKQNVMLSAVEASLPQQ